MRYSTYALLFLGGVPAAVLMLMGIAVLAGKPEWGDYWVALACIAYFALPYWRMRADARTIRNLGYEVTRLERRIEAQRERVWQHWVPLDDVSDARARELRERFSQVMIAGLYETRPARPNSERFHVEARWLHSRIGALLATLQVLEAINHEIASLRWVRAREVQLLAWGASSIALLVLQGGGNFRVLIRCQFVLSASLVCHDAWKRIKVAAAHNNPGDHADWELLDMHGKTLQEAIDSMASTIRPPMEFTN
jgi:hypothetical protein